MSKPAHEQERETTQPNTEQGERRPRMPHERDESADSQAAQPDPIIQQAHDDVESGQENTDLRGSRGRRETTVPSSRENPDGDKP